MAQESQSNVDWCSRSKYTRRRSAGDRLPSKVCNSGRASRTGNRKYNVGTGRGQRRSRALIRKKAQRRSSLPSDHEQEVSYFLGLFNLAFGKVGTSFVDWLHTSILTLSPLSKWQDLSCWYLHWLAWRSIWHLVRLMLSFVDWLYTSILTLLPLSK